MFVIITFTDGREEKLMNCQGFRTTEFGELAYKVDDLVERVVDLFKVKKIEIL